MASPNTSRAKSTHSANAAIGIRRKFDPSLPGIDESVAEIENEALPRFQVGLPPQHLTMTILGDFWAGRTEALPGAALIRLLGVFDINEPAARMAISRLAARGVLVAERRGRATWFRQTQRLLRLLPQGRAVTERFGPPRQGWDGTWTVLAWNVTNQSAALAHRIRMDLKEFGFASLASGVWVSPDAPPPQMVELLARVSDLRYSLLVGATESSAQGIAARDAWDLSAIEAAYTEFIALARRLRKHADTKRFTDEAAFVARVKAVYRWFVIATLDPDLPQELLPSDWPRVDAHALFVDLVNTVTPRADRFVRDTLAAVDPKLVPLVTTPQPYA